MDRGPQLGHRRIQAADGRLVRQTAAGNERHAGAAAIGKAHRLHLLDVGHVADRPGLEERADDRDAERAGPAGHHHVTIAIGVFRHQQSEIRDQAR